MGKNFSISLCLILLFSFCKNSERQERVELGFYVVRGVSFVGMHHQNERRFVAELDSLGLNWMSQMPFAFQRNGKPEIRFNSSRQWWGERTEGIAVTAQFAKELNIKTLLKPQIWMGGEYTGKFKLNSAEEWQSWEQDYRKYILYFAKLADSLQLEAFCIGNELQPSVLQRPAFWTELIDTIRAFYKGELTYASNWDEYTRIPFWDKLDWIGVNAYFPLSIEKTPSVKKMRSSWEKIIPEMRLFSDSLHKPIVFTEIGYKSVDACAYEPWNPASTTLNLQAQRNAYFAFLSAFNKEKRWFKGYFLWKWYPDHQKSGGASNTDYTPQRKPAQEVIRKVNGG